MTNQQKPEALRLADEFKLCNEYDSIPSINDIDKAEAELRRLNAENERLAALVDAQQPAPSAASKAALAAIRAANMQLVRHGARAAAGKESPRLLGESTMTLTPEHIAALEALAKRHGALSYRNRADTQNPAFGFSVAGLESLLAEVRKQDEALIRQMLEALEFEWGGELSNGLIWEPIPAARARLLDSDLSNLTERGAKAWAGVDAEDAARWRMLPAFFEKYQIDAMKLYRDIDSAMAANGGNK